jgi:hypothetical protein
MEIKEAIKELHKLGVTGVRIFFEGGGDSGAIEEMYYSVDRFEDADDVRNEFHSVHTNRLSSLSKDLETVIENFAYDQLNNIEDWWNNDGGNGDMYIHIPSGEFVIDVSIRYTEYNEYSHNGKALDIELTEDELKLPQIEEYGTSI